MLVAFQVLSATKSSLGVLSRPRRLLLPFLFRRNTSSRILSDFSYLSDCICGCMAAGSRVCVVAFIAPLPPLLFGLAVRREPSQRNRTTAFPVRPDRIVLLAWLRRPILVTAIPRVFLFSA